MARSVDTLTTIKQEIQNDPRGIGYAGKSPAAIGILMSADRPQATPVFRTESRDKLDLLRELLTPARRLALIQHAKNQGWVTDVDLADLQVEVLTRRCDELSLGEVTQGDVEQALK